MTMPIALGAPTVRFTIRPFVLGLAALAAVMLVAAAGRSVERLSTGTQPVTQSMASAPVALQAAVASTLGASTVRRDGAIVSTGGGLSTSFTGAGPVVRVGGTPLALSFAGIGYGAHLALPRQATPSATGNHISYRRAGVTEWYRNSSLGLEQGFTLAHRPAASSGLLTVAVRTSGPLHLSQHGSHIAIARTAGGATLATYGGLTAIDAAGRTLPSTLALENRTLLLRVNDAGATYPLTIDPIFGSSKLFGQNDEIGASAMGTSVAISADGNTAVVGAPGDNTNVGAVWVYALSAGDWEQEAKLTGAGEIGAGRFGVSVAVSDDGNTALIGGSGDNANAGAAWVFVRSATVWTAQGAKLVGTGQDNTNGGANFGSAVALSFDGNTALIGASRDYVSPTNPGSAFAFTRSGTTWTQQGAKINGTGGTAAFLLFGASLSLSNDGNTALIGGPADGNGPGAVWIFTRTGSVWTQQGAKLVGSGASGDAHLGRSVSLSGDGNTAVAGGANDGSNIGAVWVFTRTAGAWTQQGAKLVANDEEEDVATFGQAVSVSPAGDTILIGGSHQYSDIGAAWMFTRSGSGSWTQQGAKLLPADREGDTQAFGSSVSLSDGLTSLIGAPSDASASGRGSAFVYPMIAPSIPVDVTAFSYDSGAIVDFTTDDDPAFTSYTAIATPGGTSVTGGTNYLFVDGLTNGTSYTFRVSAMNPMGSTDLSQQSNAVTPAPLPPQQQSSGDPAPAPAPAPGPAPVDPTPPTASGTPASPGTVTSDDGTTVVWPAGTFSVPVTVTATASIGLTRTTLAVGSHAIDLLVKDAAGAPVTTFSAPIALVFLNVPTGAVPAYSRDEGQTWTAIPQIAGPTLPAGYLDGWFRDAAGNVHMLTLHATAFGTLAAGSAVTAALRLTVSAPRTVNLRFSHKVKVQFTSTLPGAGRITLSAKGKTIATVQHALTGQAQSVSIVLSNAARHAGVTTVTVRASAGSELATKALKITFVAPTHGK